MEQKVLFNLNEEFTQLFFIKGKLAYFSFILTFCFSAATIFPTSIFAQENQKQVFSSNKPVQAVGHRFGIKFNQVQSKLSYNVEPNELANGIQIGFSPNILIVGSLSVNSLSSASKCVVRLPNSILKATNEAGDTIDIQLRGTIGDKVLSTDFVHPTFDALNETEFKIEGYIDPRSFQRGLPPGNYDFQKNLNLIVEFL